MIIVGIILLAALVTLLFTLAALRLAALSGRAELAQARWRMRLFCGVLLVIAGGMLLAAAFAGGLDVGFAVYDRLSHPPGMWVSRLIDWLEWTGPLLLAAALVTAYASTQIAQQSGESSGVRSPRMRWFKSVVLMAIAAVILSLIAGTPGFLIGASFPDLFGHSP